MLNVKEDVGSVRIKICVQVQVGGGILRRRLGFSDFRHWCQGYTVARDTRQSPNPSTGVLLPFAPPTVRSPFPALLPVENIRKQYKINDLTWIKGPSSRLTIALVRRIGAHRRGTVCPYRANPRRDPANASISPPVSLQNQPESSAEAEATFGTSEEPGTQNDEQRVTEQGSMTRMTLVDRQISPDLRRFEACVPRRRSGELPQVLLESWAYC